MRLLTTLMNFFCDLVVGVLQSVKTKPISCGNRIIPDKPIQIQPAPFSDRISVQPPTDIRVVHAIAVVVASRFGVDAFGGEPEFEVPDEGAGLEEGAAEGVVAVVGDDGAGGVYVLCNVPVAVGEGVIGTGADEVDGEVAADAAGALECAGEVQAPEVGAGK